MAHHLGLSVVAFREIPLAIQVVLSQKGQDQVQRQPAADAGAKPDRAKALQPAQVNLAAVIDAVEVGGNREGAGTAAI